MSGALTPVPTVLVLSVTLLVGVLLSELLHRSVRSTAVLFLAVGAIVRRSSALASTGASAATMVLSMVAHSSTDVLVARRFRGRERAVRTGQPGGGVSGRRASPARRRGGDRP